MKNTKFEIPKGTFELLHVKRRRYQMAFTSKNSGGKLESISNQHRSFVDAAEATVPTKMDQKVRKHTFHTLPSTFDHSHTVAPTPDHLKSLNLRSKVNKLIFTIEVSGSIQEDVVTIYKFSANEKIAISDFDGTITLGEKDLTARKKAPHDGVPKMYQEIAALGYQWILLSFGPFTGRSDIHNYLEKWVLDKSMICPVLASPCVARQALLFFQREGRTMMKSLYMSEICAALSPTGSKYMLGFGDTNSDSDVYTRAKINSKLIFRDPSDKHTVIVEGKEISFADVPNHIRNYISTV